MRESRPGEHGQIIQLKMDLRCEDDGRRQLFPGEPGFVWEESVKLRTGRRKGRYVDRRVYEKNKLKGN